MGHGGLFAALPEGRREALLAIAREVKYPVGSRIFEEGGRADRFWVVNTGTVALDLHVPGRRAAVIDTVGPGELLGWSWLFPPHHWHLGAQATGEVGAWEFGADSVRALCARDPELDHALLMYVSETIGKRLRSARTRLLDLYGPAGSGQLR
ncbi:cyclic nucleotide-binding domain-containing protein [Streptomyces orinoci]|uniref:Cyclic nucleotide-binding domain-containing protein n=1 Tax=Streptomyces orinoci TaxID=67339 RepID=A0ABV3JZ91_STRON|nr:cyclic nucleotide-binding domain-containing protein [Streptomyces orinoci]